MFLFLELNFGEYQGLFDFSLLKRLLKIYFFFVELSCTHLLIFDRKVADKKLPVDFEKLFWFFSFFYLKENFLNYAIDAKLILSTYNSFLWYSEYEDVFFVRTLQY